MLFSLTKRIHFCYPHRYKREKHAYFLFIDLLKTVYKYTSMNQKSCSCHSYKNSIFNDLEYICLRGLHITEGTNLYSTTHSHIQGVYQFSSVQSLSCVPLSATPRTAAHQASLSITNARSLLKLMSITLVETRMLVGEVYTCSVFIY